MVDVAEGVEPVTFDAADDAGRVHVQPGTRSEADCVQADVVGVGCAAGGEDDFVGLQLAAVVEGEADRSGGVGAAQGSHLHSDPYVRARLGQAACDELAREGFHPGQQGAAGEQGGLGAEALPEGCHLDADPAAADDDEPGGDGAGIGAVPVRPGAGLVDARDVGQHRATAGGDGHGVPGDEGVACAVVPGDGDPAGAVDPAVAAEEVGADGLDPLGLPGVVPIGDVAVAAGEDLGGVESAGDGLPGAVHPLSVGDGDYRSQQCFAGDTGPVGAFTANEFTLHDGDAEAGGTGAVGDVLSDRACAQDDHVMCTIYAVF